MIRGMLVDVGNHCPRANMEDATYKRPTERYVAHVHGRRNFGYVKEDIPQVVGVHKVVISVQYRD